MPAQDCLLTIALTNGAGGHDIAYDPSWQAWNFPLDYEYEGGPPSSALISFDGKQQLISTGQQQVTGTSQVVTIAWELGAQNSGVLFRVNPYNQPDVPGGYPIIDYIIDEQTANLQVAVSDSPVNWTVETVVFQLDGGSAASIGLYVDGNLVADLPVGYTSNSATGSVVEFRVAGVTGNGIEIRYNLAQAAPTQGRPSKGGGAKKSGSAKKGRGAKKSSSKKSAGKKSSGGKSPAGRGGGASKKGGAKKSSSKKSLSKKSGGSKSAGASKKSGGGGKGSSKKQGGGRKSVGKKGGGGKKTAKKRTR